MRELTVIGLGNTEAHYEWSRHQAGFMILDQVALNLGATFQFDDSLNALVAVLPGTLTRLIKPQTGMNHSGNTVAAAMRGRPLSSLLLVYDDINVLLGALKYTVAASHGGHNGVKHVHETLGTNDFCALRFGFGPKPSGSKFEFVTEPVEEALRDPYTRCVAAAAKAVPAWCEFGMARASSLFNGKKLLQS